MVLMNVVLVAARQHRHELSRHRLRQRRCCPAGALARCPLQNVQGGQVRSLRDGLHEWMQRRGKRITDRAENGVVRHGSGDTSSGMNGPSPLVGKSESGDDDASRVTEI